MRSSFLHSLIMKFKAAVAYYPPCSVATDQLTIPTIILIGEPDDWSPAKDCERWMERRAGKGAPVKLVIYPGAYHSFDLPNVGKKAILRALAQIRRGCCPALSFGNARILGGATGEIDTSSKADSSSDFKRSSDEAMSVIGHFWDVPTNADDVCSEGKTGSRQPTI